LASTHGTISSHRYEWYRPVPGESRNWLPPYAVQPSAKTTIAGGTSPLANRASTSSGYGCRNGVRLNHMPACPLYPGVT
jgi:hypothetical protein